MVIRSGSDIEDDGAGPSGRRTRGPKKSYKEASASSESEKEEMQDAEVSDASRDFEFEVSTPKKSLQKKNATKAPKGIAKETIDLDSNGEQKAKGSKPARPSGRASAPASSSSAKGKKKSAPRRKIAESEGSEEASDEDADSVSDDGEEDEEEQGEEEEEEERDAGVKGRKRRGEAVSRKGKGRAKVKEEDGDGEGEEEDEEYREEGSDSEPRSELDGEDGSESDGEVARKRRGKGKGRASTKSVEAMRTAGKRPKKGANVGKKTGGTTDEVVSLSDESEVVPVERAKPSPKKVKAEDEALEDKKEEKKDIKKKKAILSSLPVIVPPKLEKNIVLLQCGNESLDFSGDIGSVGRIKVDNKGLLIDLKGILFSGDTVPCQHTTMCIVNVGATDAKIEAVLDNFVQLKETGNVFDSEAVVDGVMDDSFYDDFNLDASEPSKADAGKAKKRKGRGDGDDNGEGNGAAKKTKKFKKKRAESSGKLKKFKAGKPKSKAKSAQAKSKKK